MQVSLGRIFAVKEQLSAKGSTPDAEFKVRLPDPYALYFMHECGVLSGELLKVGEFIWLSLLAL